MNILENSVFYIYMTILATSVFSLLIIIIFIKLIRSLKVSPIWKIAVVLSVAIIPVIFTFVVVFYKHPQEEAKESITIKTASGDSLKANLNMKFEFSNVAC